MAILAISGAIMVGVERIHVDIQTRDANKNSNPSGSDQSMKASILGLPELSFTIDGEKTDEEVAPSDDGSIQEGQELTLDTSLQLVTTSPLIPCPKEFPICNVEYVNGFPVCPPYDDPCKSALVDYFGAYAKENKPVATTSTAPSGPTIFDPFGIMRKAHEEASAAVNKVKESGESALKKFKDWSRRGSLTVTTVHKSSDKKKREELDLEKKKQETEALKRQEFLSVSVPIYMATMSEDRSESLTPEQVKILFAISKDLANEDFVKELIDATGITCDEIIENTTRFINEQLDDGTSQISQAADKNKLLIMYMAMQLGMSKMPDSNMWQWAQIPASLVKKEVCGE